MKHKKYIQFFDTMLRKSDRSTVIGIFFVLFFLAITGKMFSYTVSNYDFYSNLADKQQIGTVVVPVTRWTIYSSTDGGTVFGTSVNLYDIAIDPQVEGSKAKLTDFLVDIVYRQICEFPLSSDCRDNLFQFLWVIDFPEFSNDPESIQSNIREVILEKVNKKKVTSVFVDQELDAEQISALSVLWIPGLYPNNNFLYINPQEIQDIDHASKQVAIILWTNQEKIKYLMRDRLVRYVPIVSRLSIPVSEYIKNFLEEESLAIKKWLIDRSQSVGRFIIMEPNPNRYYPEWNIWSQIVWFVDKQSIWNYGIEWYFDDILQWNNGKIVSRKDIRGRIIDPIGLKKSDITGEWVKVYTSIDRNIQKKVESILVSWVDKYQANRGSIVVMEPKTGRVIAMANAPTFDLNNYWEVYELERVSFWKYPDPAINLLWLPVFVVDSEHGEKFFYDNKEIFLRSASREEVADPTLIKYKYKNDFWPQVYVNDAISWLYEPGSIMKTITVAIGLDTGEISRWSTYNDIGEVVIDGFPIRNDSEKCLGYHSFAHALNYSCNIGMIRIVQRIGKVLFHQYLEDFWFSSPTWISLSWETYATLKPHERWSVAQLLTNSYGLWVSVTPLQMAASYSTIANGWVHIRPRVIDSLEFPDGRMIEYKPEKERRVIKEATSQTLNSMLVSSIDDGAARNGGVDGYSLAGKTGTSQIPYRGGYEKWIWSTWASFAWYGPAEDPQFVIIVKLERPRTTNYGWQSSAYLFSEISEYLLQYYGIPKKK